LARPCTYSDPTTHPKLYQLFWVLWPVESLIATELFGPSAVKLRLAVGPYLSDTFSDYFFQ
jgi:hypothetical protein